MSGRSRRASTAERREALLAAAERLFGSRPYDEVSMDDVADAVGVAHGLPFHYFGSKRGLYLAMIDRWNAHRLARFEQNTEDDPGAWLRAELTIIMDDAEHDRETFVRLARESAGTEVGEVRSQLWRRARTRLVERLAPESEPPELDLAIGAWMAFESEFIAIWAETPHSGREDVVEILVDVFTATLTSAAEGRTPAAFDPRVFA